MRKKKKFEITKKEVVVTKWFIKCPRCGTVIECEYNIIEDVFNEMCGGYGVCCPTCNFEQCIVKEDIKKI
jgi:Fe2+ or Zn2+ uptake regulation protein